MKMMIRRSAVSVASLVAGLVVLSGVAIADGKYPDEMYVNLAVPEADKDLQYLLPGKYSEKHEAAPPIALGGRTRPATAPQVEWPKHTGAWVDPSKAEIRDLKGAKDMKVVSWKGTTAEGIE